MSIIHQHDCSHLHLILVIGLPSSGSAGEHSEEIAFAMFSIDCAWVQTLWLHAVSIQMGIYVHCTGSLYLEEHPPEVLECPVYRSYLSFFLAKVGKTNAASWTSLL